MADARSLLRASREARKVKHPHASYTSDGKLLCNLCDIPVKTESAWQAHLHTSQHTLRHSRAKEAAALRSASGGGKKRKASNMDSPAPDDRKRAKPTFAPGVEEDEEGSAGAEEAVHEDATDVIDNKTREQANLSTDEAADPEELEAFERELAEMERSMKAETATTITAPAMSAEEIAAQAREDQSTQRGKRDAEIEGEREDAALRLQEEFEEMEGLEERARKLRARREALRSLRGKDGVLASSARAEQSVPDAPQANGNTEGEYGDDREDDDDDDDDYEEYDQWNFGGS